MWPSNPASGCTSKGSDMCTLRRYLSSHVPCSSVHSSQDRESTCMSVSGWLDRENVTHMHVHTCMHTGILFGLPKRRKFCHGNMDKPEGHYTKWNKPGTERRTAWSHVLWALKMSHLQKQGVEWWWPGAWELGGRWGTVMLVKENKVSVTQDEEFWRSNVRRGDYS